ncbi:MAG: Rrf2 family transcriptional regulator [Rhodospirillales bacterium]|nr:Rrf2 family transcriptional regulator [Rhodospirillales bacterium]
MRLSRKTLFAIEAVLDIAYHSGADPVQSREITQRQGIPRRYLEQALQNLVRHGVLVGVRGPRGGYRLARERRRITIGEIVRVVRSGDPDEEDEDEDTNGSPLAVKVVRPLWQELQQDIMLRLDQVTIDDLCLRANDAGISSEGRTNLDFSI